MKQEPLLYTFEKFKARLKKAGLKATVQRLAVHEAMTELGHASADMVSRWLDENSTTHVTVASVYNILAQLAELGIYSYRMSANNKMYFDVNTTGHMHVYDCENHSFRDLMDERLYEDILQRIGSRRFRGYRIEGVDIQFIVRPTRRRP